MSVYSNVVCQGLQKHQMVERNAGDLRKICRIKLHGIVNCIYTDRIMILVAKLIIIFNEIQRRSNSFHY